MVFIFAVIVLAAATTMVIVAAGGAGAVAVARHDLEFVRFFLRSKSCFLRLRFDATRKEVDGRV